MIKDNFRSAIHKKSDINEHLTTLKKYADEVEHITEFGVRWVTSTWAFLASKAKTIISYDINTNKQIEACKKQCETEGRDWTFVKSSSLDIEIDETDLLFIDTLHSYDQLKAELELHHSKAKKYIICHDTETFGRKDSLGNNKGLMDAIEEFLEKEQHWMIDEHHSNNNGLTILKKRLTN